MDRKQIVLQRGWKFSEACGPQEQWSRDAEGAWYKGFDDSGWREVTVPHDWSVEQPFSRECSSGTGYLPGGVGWYRTRFSLPEEYRGKNIQVVFDGIYKNSQVWCNSYYLGKRPYGYSTFAYDITHAAAFGDVENVIAVKVTHTDLADSRWFTGSGITRKVSLIIQETVHPAEYGVFFLTSDVRADENAPERRTGRAQIEVRHQIEGAAAGEKVHVRTVLTDTEGEEAAVLEGDVSDGSGCILSGGLTGAQLWSPEHPVLYRMKTWYVPDGGSAYLADEQSVGIRSIRFDPGEGFFLNGAETKLKGVCVHHDGGALGAAMKAEVWQRRLEILKECGCNAIRCSHNPHMPELYDLCDKMGFLMMDEAFDEWENAKNKWSTGHNVYPPKHQGYYEDFPKWHEEDLRAMVRRDRNHPSVILWSIGNEIDYPNDPYCHPSFETMTGNNDANKPTQERQYNADKPNAERLVTIAGRLAQIVRQEDQSRPVTLAAAFPELSAETGLFDSLDVVGYNYKEHLYAKDHERFPGKPFLGSENGHSYRAWLAVKDNPYISGQFLWTGIDYLGEAGGWPVRGSMAGILTCAGDRKPEFYRRKSFWLEEPQLALAARPVSDGPEDWRPMKNHWNYEPGQEILVKIYSNLPEVSLGINGEEIERLNEYNGDGVYCFRVKFVPGTLTAKGYEPNSDAPVLQTSLISTGQADQISCNIWRGQDMLTGKSWEKASGEPGYLYQLELKLQDAEGRDVSWQERQITVTVDGAGCLAGLESGNLADVTPYSENTRSTFVGRLLVFIRRNAEGPIRVQFAGEGEIVSETEL